jgi:hypothetical protein
VKFAAKLQTVVTVTIKKAVPNCRIERLIASSTDDSSSRASR